MRSSATAEDLPTASFAGQQDTYLNVVGPAAVLAHVSRCWASLFTERAVTYRLRNGFDHRKVQMAVVVQRMVFPEASGILFTADPVTGNRKVAAVDASFGLGEALVSGLVNPDVFKVRDGEVVARTIAAKQRRHRRRCRGAGRGRWRSTRQRQEQPALTDAQVVRLVQLGRRIEAHFGRPQDIEWCLVDDDFQIVQSRPITTLFPVPAATTGEPRLPLRRPPADDDRRHEAAGALHVAADGHGADARGRRAAVRRRHHAAGLAGGPRRLPGRSAGRADPLIRDALETLLDRGDFVPTLPDSGPAGPPAGGAPAPIENDPAIVTELIERSEASIAALRRDIATVTGPALFDFLLEAFQEHKRVLGDPLSMQAIMAGMEATWWLNDQLREWLGEKNAADTLTLSAPGNITSEMGLALLDVADVIRPHPEVVAFLRRRRRDDGFLDDLPKLAGGAEARDAIEAYLDRYGMRCVGEIDITRPRWSERPGTLVPVILDNVRLFEPGAAAAALRAGAAGGAAEGAGGADAPAGAAGRGAEGRRDQADDRPGTDLHRLPGVPEVRHHQPLLRLQAGPAGRGRAPGAGRRAGRAGGRLLPHVPGVPRGRARAAGWTTS